MFTAVLTGIPTQDPNDQRSILATLESLHETREGARQAARALWGGPFDPRRQQYSRIDVVDTAQPGWGHLEIPQDVRKKLIRDNYCGKSGSLPSLTDLWKQAGRPTSVAEMAP
jgi:hypothetical protein